MKRKRERERERESETGGVRKGDLTEKVWLFFCLAVHWGARVSVSAWDRLGQTGTDWDWAAELCLYYGVLSGKGKTEVFECA